MLTRIIEQWGVTLALLLVFTRGCQRDLAPNALRMALFVGAMSLLYQERKRLRAVFVVLGERLRRAGEAPRPSWSQRSLNQGRVILLWVAWTAPLVLFSPTLHRVFQRPNQEILPKLFVLWLIAGAWAAATALWLTVAMDRVSLWRRTSSAWRLERAELKRARAEATHRAEAARLAGEEGPGPPPPRLPSTIPLRHPPSVMPSYAAASAGAALLVALLGLPSARTVFTVGTIALDALDVPRTAKVELLLELGEDDELSEVLPTLLAHGVIPRRAFPTVSPVEDADLAATWVLSVDLEDAPGLAKALRADPENVDRIELNSAVDVDPGATPTRCVTGGASLPVNDPLASAQRELEAIGADTALRALRAGASPRTVRVGVIDTGIDGRHEDLRGVLSVWSHSGDPRGHGTRVAGVLAGLANNGVGIASLNVGGELIELVSYPALAREGADVEDVVDGIVEAIDDEVDVLNLSFSAPLEGGAAPHAVQRAIARALANGIIVVASAGNTPRLDAGQVWPASLPGVIVVASGDAWGRVGTRSSSVSGVRRAILAPGEAICTTSAGGGYVAETGTSFAAPMVSGSLALARSLCPGLDADGAWRLLQATGRRQSYSEPVQLRVDQLLGSLLQEGCP